MKQNVKFENSKFKILNSNANIGNISNSNTDKNESSTEPVDKILNKTKKMGNLEKVLSIILIVSITVLIFSLK